MLKKHPKDLLYKKHKYLTLTLVRVVFHSRTLHSAAAFLPVFPTFDEKVK